MPKNLRKSFLLELRKLHSKMKVNRDEVDTIPICFNESGLTEWILFCKEKKKNGGGAVAVVSSQKILFSFWLDQAEHISRTEIIFFFFFFQM